MSAQQDEEPPVFVVLYTEHAEIDRDTLFLNLQRAAPQYAILWLSGLLLAVERLAEAPRIHPLAREQRFLSPNPTSPLEIRRLLYYGPSGRRGRNRPAWRVLYRVEEAKAGETMGQVIVLRILHSNQDIMHTNIQESDDRAS